MSLCHNIHSGSIQLIFQSTLYNPHYATHVTCCFGPTSLDVLATARKNNNDIFEQPNISAPYPGRKSKRLIKSCAFSAAHYVIRKKLRQIHVQAFLLEPEVDVRPEADWIAPGETNINKL